MATEHIYTVSSMYDIHNTGVDVSTAKSYRTFDAAVEGCADIIMECLNGNAYFREALAMDENHAELAGFIESVEDAKDGYPEILDPIAVREHVRSELRGGGFCVWNGYDSYHFYITENDLVD